MSRMLLDNDHGTKSPKNVVITSMLRVCSAQRLNIKNTKDLWVLAKMKELKESSSDVLGQL